MAIGVDMDGVLAEFLEHYILFHNERYGTQLHPDHFTGYSLGQTIGISPEEDTKRLYEFYETDHFRRMHPVPGSQHGTARLAEKDTLVVVTARQFEIMEATRQWVDTYFPDRFRDITFGNHYGKTPVSIPKATMCKKYGVDTLIEDSLSNAYSCAAAGINVLLYDQPWNQTPTLPERVQRVYSWDEIVERLA